MAQLLFEYIEEGERAQRDSSQILDSWNLPGVLGFNRWLRDVEPRILTSRNRYEIFRPTAKQTRVFEEMLACEADGRFAFSLSMLCYPRRHGKTTCFALALLHLVTSRRNFKVQLLGNTEFHSRRTQFDLMKRIISNSPKLAAMIPKSNFSLYEINYPAMQSVIQMSMGTSSATAFGEKINALWVSDLHAAADLGPFNAFQASLLDSEDSVIFVDSNIDHHGGTVHSLEQLAAIDDTVFCDRVEYKDFADFNARAPQWIDRARSKRLKVTQLPAEYARDILGKRSAVTSALFPPEVVERCLADYKHPVDDPAVLARGRAYKIGGGLDRSKSLIGGIGRTDNTVWTVTMKVATQSGEPEIYVLSQTVFRLNVAHAIKAQILRDHEKFHFDFVALENFETQDLAPWCVQNKIPVELVSPTSSYQNQIFPHLSRLAREGRLHFPKSMKRLASELSTFVYKQLPGGKYSFMHATQKQKDDTVFSLAASIFSMRTAVLTMYILGNVQCVSKNVKRRFCYIMGGDAVLHCSERCSAHKQVEDMLKEYQQFTEDDPLIADFFKTRVKVKGAKLYQAA